jgi:hypothetical protein
MGGSSSKNQEKLEKVKKECTSLQPSIFDPKQKELTSCRQFLTDLEKNLSTYDNTEEFNN